MERMDSLLPRITLIGMKENVMLTNTHLTDVVAAVRPALQAAPTTPAERAQLAYDLLRELYEHVKFDVDGPDVDSEERSRLGEILNAALPPTGH